jgi:FkbM family methyltransferase
MKLRLGHLFQQPLLPVDKAIWRVLLSDRTPMDGDTIRFLQFALANASRSQAMQLQDLWVLHELGEARGGFFVEFGAADGIELSNTLLLERGYGWRGILAEPHPNYGSALHANRPTAAVSTKCVWSRTGERIAFAQTRNPLFSTVVSVASSDLDRKKRMKSRRVEVETISLNDLLSSCAAPATIDFMSVDVEGAELEILRAFDFDRWRVRLFAVEHNHTPAERDLDALMNRNGYERRFPDLSLHDGWYRAPTE